MPVDYSNTHIYKLCCKDLAVTEVYIGSTTNFNERKRQHRDACCKEQDKRYCYPVYWFVRDNGGWANWDMVLIDTVSVSGKLEAHKVERRYVESFNAVLNAKIPSRTYSEWRADNDERLKERSKQYWLDNKEKIKEYKKQWRTENKDEINEKKRQWRAKKREEQLNANL